MTLALITGCASGFGERAALALARRGVTVAACVRDFGRAQALWDAAARDSLPIERFRMDVRDETSVRAAVQEIEGCLGPLDIAINNAGLHLIAPAELCRIEDAQAILDTNVLGPLRVMQAVLPGMRARGGGRIVNVTSGGSFVAVPHMAMYTASKHAADALSAAMANEVKPFGVRIVTVAPGTFRTAMTQKGILPRETYGYSAYAAEQCARHIRDIDEGPDPEPVADAIVAAALNPDPPLRTLVGQGLDRSLGPVVALHDSFQSWFAPTAEQLSSPNPTSS
ncbi:SDR family NAD(P)-dependent oxidoreductase [Zavarzinia sp. CC-PAN008]|uniref:SDR family NAD(P)-dependent oxidoreductase n=1 Tax=Zavarzinia sp. CC-PAN008 TaxID=3243332 RepID=UPI003F7476B7